MTKLCLLLALSLYIPTASAQFYDNFSDGDFISSPQWITESGNFVINQQGQLQSTNTEANQAFAIYTSSNLSDNGQWEFWVKLDFNTSSANYVDIWLMSHLGNLNANDNQGYFIRLGTTKDNISLNKKVSGKTIEPIITGDDGIFNKSSSTIKIKAIRGPDSQWILLRDITGTGTSYRSVGSAHDNNISSSEYFGISIRQSTASFFGKHYFDDFDVRKITNFPSSLNLTEVSTVNGNTIKVRFDQPLNVQNAENPYHYHVNTLGVPQSVTVDQQDGAIVFLSFTQSISPNATNNLLVDGVQDIYGNIISNEDQTFIHFKPVIYDVVINEVFADPSPQIGMPNSKFIELKNNTDKSINLSGWRLVSGSKTAILPTANIGPDEYLIITNTGGYDAYSQYGNTISVSNFPTLLIGGDELVLQNESGELIHAMHYDLSTYKNPIKQDGGFSLEMINPLSGCISEDNWAASKASIGGTPGKINSIYSSEITTQNITISNVFLRAKDTLMVLFNKPVDSLPASNPINYSISPILSIKSIQVLPPFFDQVKIALSNTANEGSIYTITVNGLIDCAGNEMAGDNAIAFGVSQTAGHGDLVINEILSNPKTSGGEYIELYNKSKKILALNTLYLANRNSSGEIASITRISDLSTALLPGEFLLLTKNKKNLVRDFPLTPTKAVFQMTSMPSYPNDKGFILVLNQQGEVLDEVAYDKSWHFQLIKDTRGIALERIDYDGLSVASNFHSASKSVGYGTPGYKNSQSSSDISIPESTFHLVPEVFSPDNDGIDDYLTIHYNLGISGYITNIKIFDARGRLVRYLEKNTISSTKGYYRWDGLDDKNQKLSQGIYIIYFEAFNENGQKIVHKKAITLARRF